MVPLLHCTGDVGSQTEKSKGKRREVKESGPKYESARPSQGRARPERRGQEQGKQGPERQRACRDSNEEHESCERHSRITRDSAGQASPERGRQRVDVSYQPRARTSSHSEANEP